MPFKHNPLRDGLVSKEGAVEEERVAARAVEERPAVLRLVVREGAVDERRTGDAVVDRPARPRGSCRRCR